MIITRCIPVGVLVDTTGRYHSAVPVTFSWDPTRAYQLTVTISDDPADEDARVEWLIGRNLLAGCAGDPDGDVSVHHLHEMGVVTIGLTGQDPDGPDGHDSHITLIVPPQPLTELLTRTYELVGFGEDVPDHAVDTLIHHIFQDRQHL